MSERLIAFIGEHGFDAWTEGALIVIAIPEWNRAGDVRMSFERVEPTVSAVKWALGY